MLISPTIKVEAEYCYTLINLYHRYHNDN